MTDALTDIIRIFFLSGLAFIVAFLLAPVLTHFLYRHRLGKQIRDEASAPIMAKLHAAKSGTPTMGGVLVWGTVLVLILFFHFGGEVWPTLAGFDFFSRKETVLPLGALIASALVGLVNDFLNVRRIGPHGGGLRMRHRILLYTGIALIGALWFYFKLDWDVLRVPFLGNYDIGWLYIPFAAFVIMATAFSVNEADGLDGLAAGILLACFTAYGALAFVRGKPGDLAAFCGVIVGALLAFLWFNINPARFFMGDTGAMSLGVTLGIVALLTNAPLLLPIIGVVFVAESMSVIIQMLSKKFLKRKAFLSTPLHHHFEAKGWPEPKVVMRFWVISVVATVIGLVLALVDFNFFL